MAVEQTGINNLVTLIKQHITPDALHGDVLQITGNDLSSSVIQSVFQNSLQSAALTLHHIHIDPIDNSVGTTVRVTGMGFGVPFDTMQVVAVFTLKDDHSISLLVTVTAPQVNIGTWTLTQNFPALQGTVYEHIHLSNPQFTLSSEDSGTVKKGLTFSATLDVGTQGTFTGPYANLTTLWHDAPPLHIAGGITLDRDNHPIMDLATSQSWLTQLDNFAVQLGITLHAARTTDQQGTTSFVAQLQISAQLDNGQTTPLALNGVFDTGTKTLTFTAETAQLDTIGINSLITRLFPDGKGPLPANYSFGNTLKSALCTIVVGLNPRQLSSVALDVQQGDPWSPFDGMAQLHDIHVSLSIAHPFDRQHRQVTCDIAGTLQVAQQAAFAATLSYPDYSITGSVLSSHETGINLSDIISTLLSGKTLPEEVPHLIFNSLTLFLSLSQGKFNLKGNSVLALALPFGVSDLLVSNMELDLSWGAVAQTDTSASSSTKRITDISLAIGSSFAHPVTIVEQLSFSSMKLSFLWDRSKQDWSLAGTIGAIVFDSDFSLTASLEQSATERVFKLEAIAKTQDSTSSANTPAKGLILNLGNDSTLTFDDLTILISKRLAQQSATSTSAAQQNEEQGIALNGSAYSWQASATGGIEIANVSDLSLQGQMIIWNKDKSTGLKFKPDTATVTLALSEQPSFALKLGLDALSIIRYKAVEDGATQSSWSIDTTIDVALTTPDNIKQFFPTQSTQGHFVVNKREVTISASPLLTLHDFAITGHVVGQDIDLGKAAGEITSITLDLTQMQLAAEFGLGLPEKLNDIFGTKDGKASVNAFKVYQAGDETSLLHLKAAIEKNGVSIHLLDSPILAIQPEPGSQGDANSDPIYKADMGEFGAFEFKMPTFSYSGTSLSASGHFQQATDKDGNLVPLSLPLTPFKALLSAMHLDALSKAVPRGLPLKEIKLLSDDGTTFNGTAFVAMLNDLIQELSNTLHTPSFTLDDTIASGFQALGNKLERLPQSFKDYLDIVIPGRFDFALSLSETGSFQGSLTTDQPIKVLYPTLGLLGPQLNGLTLRSISVGEIFEGVLLTLKADMDIHQFTLPTLLAALLPDSIPDIPDSRSLVTHIPIHKLFMLIILETGIPVPIPIFFDQLGLEYLGLEGVHFQVHGSFPDPLDTLGLSDFTKLFSQLGDFFTHADSVLGSDLPKLLPVLTIGPNAIQLPQYMDSKQLIRADDTRFNTTVDSNPALVTLLNTLKRLTLNSIITAIPLPYRRGELSDVTSFAGLRLKAQSQWLITTPAEFRASAYQAINVTDDVLDKMLVKVVPDKPSADVQGLVLFLTGQWSVAQVLDVDAHLGLIGTANGFASGLHLGTTINGVLDAELVGAFAINPHPTNGNPVFSLSGSSSLAVLGQNIFDGSFALTNQRFDIHGHLTLFDAWTKLLGVVKLDGSLSSSDFYLEGYSALTVGKNFTIAQADILIRHDGLTITGTALYQTIVFSAHKINNELQFLADLTPVNLADIVTITSTQADDQGPHAALSVGNHILNLALDGKIAIPPLNTSGQGTFVINETGFDFRIMGDLFALFTASLHVWGANMYDEASINVDATITDGIKQLEQKIKDVLNEEANAVNKLIKPFEDRVNGLNQLPKVDVQGDITVLKAQIADFKSMFVVNDSGDTPLDRLKKELDDRISALGDEAKSLDVIGLANNVGGILTDITSGLLKTIVGSVEGMYEIVARAEKVAEDTVVSIGEQATQIAAHEVLSAVQQLNDKVWAAFNYIEQNTLDRLLTINSITFSERFSTVRGGLVTLKLDLQYLGKTYSDTNPHADHPALRVSFNFNSSEESIKAMAKQLLSLDL